MKKISLDTKIYSLIKEHPDIKDIMFELGFKDIVKKNILQTVGRIMTLRKGCYFRNIEIRELVDFFAKYQYEFIDES